MFFLLLVQVSSKRAFQEDSSPFFSCSLYSLFHVILGDFIAPAFLVPCADNLKLMCVVYADEAHAKYAMVA